MTSVIFEKWFRESFVPCVRRLLRAKGIEEKADGKITVFYLPKNTTS
jgi:hypothetical protein